MGMQVQYRPPFALDSAPRLKAAFPASAPRAAAHPSLVKTPPQGRQRDWYGAPRISGEQLGLGESGVGFQIEVIAVNPADQASLWAPSMNR